MSLIRILEAREEAITVKQVAELLGVSDKHIYEMVADGRLPAFRVGRSIRFDAADIVTWLREKKLPLALDHGKGRHKGGRNGSQSRPHAGSSALYGALRRRVHQLEAAAACEETSPDSPRTNQ